MRCAIFSAAATLRRFAILLMILRHIFYFSRRYLRLLLIDATLRFAAAGYVDKGCLIGMLTLLLPVLSCCC